MKHNQTLTVGFCTIDDPRAALVLNVFESMHRHVPHEFIIIDNSAPGSPIAKQLESHVAANHPRVRYIRDEGPTSSCLHKDRLFREATGDVVVCFDAHVYFEPETIPNLMRFFQERPDSPDLLMGPIQNAANRVQATNQFLFASEGYTVPKDATVRQGVICRGGQLGIWIMDPRGKDPNGEPFEIQQQGTGFFAMRRSAWPGFHPGLYGFGGCEPYLMEAVRQAGGKVLCHPGCLWTHDFAGGGPRPYQPLAIDKVRNYLVTGTATGRQDLYLAALEHFSGMYPGVIGQAVVDAQQVIAGDWQPAPRAAWTDCKNGKCATKGKPHPAEKPKESAKPRAAADAEPPPEKPGVYEKYIAPWKEAGGDVGGAIPKPLFVQLCHLHAETLNGQGDMRPVKTLEFGCGLSTLAFDRQGTQHTAIEHEPKWIARVDPLLKGRGTQIVHAPLKAGWYDWQPEYGTLYDCVLIDGPPGSVGRGGCLEVVPELLAPGGMIVVDDTHRAEEQRISEELAQRLGLEAQRRTHGQRNYDLLLPPAEPLGEGPGTELLEFLKSLPNMPSCQLCHALARRMNQWGVAGCRAHLDEIVEDMRPRAHRWWSRSSKWMKAEAWFKGQGNLFDRLKAAGKSAAGIDAGLRDSIRLHVEAAIKKAESKEQSTPTRSASEASKS